MIDEKTLVISSLELNLFFARIMKEHSFFLEAGFTPANAKLSKTADDFKERFESILKKAVYLGNNVISNDILNSGEIVTEYTLKSEEKTTKYTGINLDKEITKLELELKSKDNPHISKKFVHEVKELNKSALYLIDGLIKFKENILKDVLSCRIFTMNYPHLIEHILKEAKLYRLELMALDNNQNIEESIKETELFWDRIMMEHALFIRGSLDPTEKNLIKTANNFAIEFGDLLKKAKAANDNTMPIITNMTLEETEKLHDFKKTGTIGLNECKIRSIILPLLADHVLRESNHYIRLLKQFK